MEIANEYTIENLNLAREIIADNKDYHKIRDLEERITRFELHKYAINWIEKYYKLHPEEKTEKN